MTFVSVAQAARHLGIDAKTLRRWLAEAQLPLHSHPHDGRKKGVSDEHLQLLARLHQRSLASLPRGSACPCAQPRCHRCLLRCSRCPSSLRPCRPRSPPCSSRWLISPACFSQHEPASPARRLRPSRPDGQASTQAHASCSPLSSRCQTAPQAGSCHPARRVWRAGTLCGDLSQARLAPL